MKRDGNGDANCDHDAAFLPAELSQRGTLTRQKVLAAALEVIDAGGTGPFTMRRVADRFGAEPMALYRYFPSREHLLDSVVNTVTDDLYDNLDVEHGTQDWRNFLFRVAHGARRAALAHPLLFPLIATRGPNTPGVWPPMRSTRWTQGFLRSLRDCGFDPAVSLHTYREMSRFLVGHLLLETRGATPAPRPSGMPDEPTGDRSTQEFQDSLHRMIARVAQLRNAGPA